MIEITPATGTVRLLDSTSTEIGAFASSVDALAAASALPDGDYTLRHDDAVVVVTQPVVDPGPDPEPDPEPDPDPEPGEEGDHVQIRLSLDNHNGVPMTSFTLPPVVVYKTGYQVASKVLAGVVVGADGLVTLDLGTTSGLSAGDIVWIGAAEAVGTYGQHGYETRGILTQGVVELL